MNRTRKKTDSRGALSRAEKDAALLGRLAAWKNALSPRDRVRWKLDRHDDLFDDELDGY